MLGFFCEGSIGYRKRAAMDIWVIWGLVFKP